MCNLKFLFFYGTSLFLGAILSFTLADSHELCFVDFIFFAFLCIRTQSFIAVFVLLKNIDFYILSCFVLISHLFVTRSVPIQREYL